MKATLALVSAVGLCTSIAAADPITFYNNGSLVWRAAPTLSDFSDPDPCFLASNPSLKRAFDITQGPSQTQPPAALIDSKHFCMRNQSLGIMGGTASTGMLISHSGGGIATLPVTPVPTASFGTLKFDAVRAFGPGELVGPQYLFTLAPNTDYVYSSPVSISDRGSGNLIGNRAFVGVKFQINGQTHYGWILIDFAALRSFSSTTPNPIAWAYETTPDTPIRILSTEAYSPIRTSSYREFTQSSAHYLDGPASGTFVGGVSSAMLDAARTGPAAPGAPRLSGWVNSTWVSTSANATNGHTAIYSIDFDLDPDYLPSDATLGSVDLSFAVADKLGWLLQPGAFLNQQPLANTSQVGSPTAFTTNHYPDLRSTLHAGANTLALYAVNAIGGGQGAGISVFGVAQTRYQRITVFPTSATLAASQSIQLYASVRGTDNTAVLWSAPGAAISPDGVFSASQGGTYTVTASVVGSPSFTASATITVTPPCLADFNHDGTLNPDDIADYVACFFAASPCPEADFNHDAVTDPDDLADFIAAYFGGC